MKKKLVITALSVINLLALWLLVYNYKSTKYPEVTFNNEKEVFDEGMRTFLRNTADDIIKIKDDFPQKDNPEEDLKKYFVDFLKSNKPVHSLVFVKGNKKFSIKRQDDSFVVGYDTTKQNDVVTWQRIKNDQVISTWEEIFLLSFKNMDWFKDLENHLGEIRWYFNVEKKSDKNNENLFFCGYHYRQNGADNYIILSFARMALLKNFPAFNKYDNLNLLVETANGMLFNLSSGINEYFKSSYNDTLQKRIHKRLKLFADKQNGAFSFKNGKDVIWAFFRKFDKKYGLNYYMLIIPENQLMAGIKGDNHLFVYSYLALLIASLTIIYFVFYRSKKSKTEISEHSLDELLKNDEGRTLEFKSSLRWDYRQEKVNPSLEDVVVKTIAAFGNSDGGILLIGVDDDKNILGIEKDFNTFKKKNADYFEIHLRNLLHKALGVKYVTENVRIEFAKHKEKTVCKVNVFRAGEPVFVEVKDKNGNKSEKFYVRSGNSSHEIDSLKDINDYISNRF